MRSAESCRFAGALMGEAITQRGVDIGQTPGADDGRIRLDFWHDEPDGVDAFVKALRN